MNILSHLLVAATIVLISTAGAAEQSISRLGEFVEAGEHEGRPYYRQRDTEGNSDTFLYFFDGWFLSGWLVSDILGDTSAYLRNYQASPRPPSDEWLYWDGNWWNDNDTSLTSEFTTFPPCQLVRVAGEGDVVKKRESELGDYRSLHYCAEYHVECQV